MKKVLRVIAMLMAIVTFSCVLSIPAEAANNACAAVEGNTANHKKWTTITVKTGKNWGSNKITFSQTKGDMHYGWDAFETECYGNYTITVKDHKTGKTQTFKWKNSANYTLKLKDNRTYTIKIKAYQPETVGHQNLGWSRWLSRLFGGYDKDAWCWNNAPTWRVKSTKAVDWCYSAG